MELDEFKTIILKRPVNLSIEHIVTWQQTVSRKRSSSVIGKIKKSLKLEMMFAMIFVFLVLIITYKLANIYLEIFAWIVAVVCLAFTAYIARLYRKIIFFQVTMNSVKKNLQQTIAILKQFTRLYYLLTLVMVPVILVAAVFCAYASMGLFNNSYLPFSLQQLISLPLICIAWYAAVYFFTKWYIRKLYGDHLESLQTYLKELEEE